MCVQMKRMRKNSSRSKISFHELEKKILVMRCLPVHCQAHDVQVYHQVEPDFDSLGSGRRVIESFVERGEPVMAFVSDALHAVGWLGNRSLTKPNRMIKFPRTPVVTNTILHHFHALGLSSSS